MRVLQSAVVTWHRDPERVRNRGQVVRSQAGQEKRTKLERIKERIGDRNPLAGELGGVELDALADDWIVAEKGAKRRGHLVQGRRVRERGVVDAGQQTNRVGNGAAGRDERAPLVEHALLIEADRGYLDDAGSGGARL